jgi:hypothetical protein
VLGDKIALDCNNIHENAFTADSLLVYEIRPVRSYGILVDLAFLVKT